MNVSISWSTIDMRLTLVNTIYPDEALSQHYDKFHLGTLPDLAFSILDKELSTVKRKIKEAFYISNEKPSINKKDECVMLKRFLVKH